MTFQPPPPPPGGNPPQPPPPPGGQWGPPPGGGAYGGSPQGGGSSFDPKSVNPLDWAILGAGLLIFIFSFIDYYSPGVDISGKCGALGLGGSDSTSESAWHGFFGWFGTLMAIVGAGLIAMELFAPQVKLPIPTRLAALGAFAVALLSTLLALFIDPVSVPDDQSAGGCTVSYDVGHGFGYWVSLLLIIGAGVLTLMRIQQTGGQLPGALGNIPTIGGPGGGRPGPGAGGPGPGYGPGPGPGPGNQPPPPPGYGPPR